MSNVYIYGPLIMWTVAQLAKFFINFAQGRADARYLISSGGMPSAHAAVVSSLAMITLLDQGWTSPLFGIVAIMAAIVMYDSFGVRRSSGEQARVLNRLVSDLRDEGTLRSGKDYQTLREILGHRPLEVTVGALLGIAGGLLFEWNKVGDRLGWVNNNLSNTHQLLYAIGIGLLLVVSLAAWWGLRHQYGATKALKTQANHLLYYSLAAVVALALLLATANQNIVIVRTTGITILSWLVVLVALGILYWYQIPKIQAEFTHHDSARRKQKWLKKAGRK